MSWGSTPIRWLVWVDSRAMTFHLWTHRASIMSHWEPGSIGLFTTIYMAWERLSESRGGSRGRTRVSSPPSPETGFDARLEPVSREPRRVTAQGVPMVASRGVSWTWLYAGVVLLGASPLARAADDEPHANAAAAAAAAVCKPELSGLSKHLATLDRASANELIRQRTAYRHQLNRRGTLYQAIPTSDVGHLRYVTETVIKHPRAQLNLRKLDREHPGVDGVFQFDNEYGAQLGLRTRIARHWSARGKPDRVIAILDEEAHESRRRSRAHRKAARALAQLVMTSLPKIKPAWFSGDGGSITNWVSGQTYDAAAVRRDPLRVVSELLVEDVTLSETKAPEGPHRLIGGAVAFPTNWALHDVIGLTMDEVHAALSPHPERQARVMQYINRAMGSSGLDVQIERVNYFFERTGALPLPSFSRSTTHGRQDPWVFRTERDTMFRPIEGYIAFLIRPYTIPLEDLLALDPEIPERVWRMIGINLDNLEPGTRRDASELSLKRWLLARYPWLAALPAEPLRAARPE